MPKLRRLSGNDVVSILIHFGFQVQSQRGSHVKLKRTKDGQIQTLTIPLHKELDAGTLQAIFRQACRFITESELVQDSTQIDSPDWLKIQQGQAPSPA